MRTGDLGDHSTGLLQPINFPGNISSKKSGLWWKCATVHYPPETIIMRVLAVEYHTAADTTRMLHFLFFF